MNNNDYSYSRGRPPTDTISRITDWDINDSIIPRVSVLLLFIYIVIVILLTELLVVIFWTEFRYVTKYDCFLVSSFYYYHCIIRRVVLYERRRNG